MSTPLDHVGVIGAGASPVIAELLAAGYLNVEAVDISQAALAQLTRQLGADADRVTIRRADVRTVAFDQLLDVWHDRAVFHFRTEPSDQAAYARQASLAVRPGGHLLVAAFALDGPDRCSQLAVQRHDASSLSEAFSGSFDMVESFDHLHRTPWGAEQPFVHAILRRRNGG